MWMPVILAQGNLETWLKEAQKDLLPPAPQDDLIACLVPNGVRDEGAFTCQFASSRRRGYIRVTVPGLR